MNFREGKDASITRLFQELKAVIEKDGYSAYPQICSNSLKRQEMAAGINIPEIGVFPMALGTFKASARCLDGGFGAFDTLRRAALGVVIGYEERSATHKKKTLRSLSHQLNDIETELSDLRQDLMRAGSAIRFLMRKLNAYAKESNNPVIVTKAIQDIDAVERLLSHISTVEPISRG